jgi:hypothetical protein
MHLQAIATTESDGEERRSTDDRDATPDLLSTATGASEPSSTIGIGGRQYAVIAAPFATDRRSRDRNYSGRHQIRMSVEDLASYHRCIERAGAGWPSFVAKRRERLAQQERHGTAAEKVAEDIIADLFTEVLDWTVSDLNHQVGFADLLLSRLSVKYLLLEAKHPGALAWNARAVHQALDQACRYAAEQHVRVVAVSDGVMLYAADVSDGGLKPRVFARLDGDEAPEALWWLSVHGIYRDRPDRVDAALQLLPSSASGADEVGDVAPGDGELLHHKYHLPARCFAYAGDASNPATWHLPFRCADGSVDRARLPKAIQAILTNYRGAKVSKVPEAAVPAVLRRLSEGAAELGRMPAQAPDTAPVYRQLAEVLEQLPSE